MAGLGWSQRQARALDAAAARTCACGHPVGGHREAPSCGWALDDARMLVEVPNPDYRPFVSLCEVPGCGCEIDHRAERSSTPTTSRNTPRSG